MKKYLILAAAALLAVTACNKEKETVTPVDQNEEIVLTFTSQKPQLAETRTAWDGTTSSIIWQAADKIRVGYTLNGSWMVKDGAGADGSARFYASDPVEISADDNCIGTFKVPTTNGFTDPAVEGTYQFYAVYPHALIENTLVSNPAANTLVLPTTQSPATGSFDPSADILLGKSDAIEGTGLPTTAIELNWTRLVAHVDLTFKKLPDFDQAGESVSQITLTFNEGAKVAGSFTANIPAGTAGTGDANEIILNDKGNGFSVSEVGDDGWCIEVWACVFPVSFSALDVEIETDKAIYTRSITGISKTFKQNARNKLAVNMSTASRQEKDPTLKYERYTDALEEGMYIIYDETAGVALQAALTSSSRFESKEIESVDGIIETNDESIVWYIAQSGDYWTIYNNSISKYAASNSSSSYNVQFVETSSDQSLWALNGQYDFVNKANSKYLRFNPGYGFAGYSSGTGHTLSLYKYDSRVALDAPSSVVASLSQTVSNAIVVTFDTVTDAASYVITATPTAGGTAVTTGAEASPATIDGLLYNTEYAISVYAVPDPEDGDHKKSPSTEASETVTTGAAPVIYNAWVETSLDDIATGDVFVMVANDKYAFSSSGGSSTNPPAVEVILSENILSGEIDDAIKWNLTGNSTDGYTFYPDGATTKLFCNTNAASSSNTNLRVGNGGSYDRYIFVLVDGHLKTKDDYTDRYIGINGTSDFRGYVNISTNSATFKFYKYYAAPDNREDAGMSWSEESATASWDTGNTASGFTAPTLTAGHATGITYESTSPSVATITDAGVVTIVGPGETTIKAIFAGDDNYKPATVGYVLTVTDNREAVAKPAFSPDATGTVSTGTQVTITSTTPGATIYYTLDNSTPTIESTLYTDAITLNESKTIKAIAVKVGYKDSEVASAIYTVGVVNTSTQANPYTAAEARAVALQLAAGGTLANVYVSGIISEITTVYSSEYNNVSFNISADGLTNGTQFLIYRAHADSADDFKVGDAVEFEGTLCNYKSGSSTTTIPQLQANATLIYKIHAPSISPNGNTFTGSQSVTISADQDATIRYTVDGTEPTATVGSVYSETLTLSETTTVKAIAVKDGHASGVVSATFTKNNGGDAPQPITLTFDVSSNPGGWPTANSTTLTNYTYTLNSVDYTFALKNVKCNSGYLMVTTIGVVGLPAIEGYKLTAVVAHNSGGCSTSTKVGISSSNSSASYIDGGAIQTWSTTGSSYTYTLTTTSANTVYYLYVTNKNAQITSLELTYSPAN